MTRPLLAVFVAAAAAAATAASPVAPAAAAAESASDAPAAAGLVRASAASYASIAGDPGYLSPDAAVLLEGWNFCNEALAPPQFSTRPSPRWADCTLGGGASQVVAPSDNALGPGDPFPLPGFNATTDVNLYAETKELYLGALCSRAPAPASAPAAVGANWSYHTIMFKSGNMDVAANICPETAPAPPLRRPAARARRARRAPSARALPAASAAARASFRAGSAAGLRAGFNNLLMNQPLVQVTPSAERAVPYGGRGLVGWTSGTYDVNASWTPAEVAAVTAALEAYTAAWVAYRFAEVDGAPPGPQPTPPALLTNKSYVAAVWYRNVTSGSLVFMHIQSTSAAAPWLMNYLKLMDTNGVGSGYDWNEAGDVFGPSPAYLSRLQVTYTVLQRSKGGFGGLYVPCHGGCW